MFTIGCGCMHIVDICKLAGSVKGDSWTFEACSAFIFLLHLLNSKRQTAHLPKALATTATGGMTVLW